MNEAALRPGEPVAPAPRGRCEYLHARAAVAFFVMLAVGASARAHMGSTKYLRVELTAQGARLVADLDPIDVAYELGLDDPDAGDPAPILARADAVRTWARTAFVVRGEDGPCEPSIVAGPDVVPLAGGPRTTQAIRLTIAFACGSPNGGLVLEDRAFFASDPQHEAIVRHGDRPWVLRAGRQTMHLRGAPGPAETIRQFVLEGALHLVTGYDHVLFLLSLLATAGLVAAREGTRRAIGDVAIVVTGFTLGHSVTLVAAALDVVTLPPRLVESAIAASIVAVAGWNVARPEARRGLPAVALGFGLIHGFGFSSVLRELVLPVGERVTALLAFNVGIEIGQIAIVLAVMPLLAWLGRQPWYRRAVVQVGSLAIAFVASVWLVERALGSG